MAKTKIEQTKDIIENYTKENLDVYMIELLKALAEDIYTDEAIASEDKPQRVADGIYDYLYENCRDDAKMSVYIKNLIPKDIMLIMRQEIMKALG